MPTADSRGDAPRPMDPSEAARRLERLPHWRREGAGLVRQVRFGSFMEAIGFVKRIADVAEAMDHHPDILISYRQVTFTLTSHDAGGITARDFALAGEIDRLLGDDGGVVEPTR